LPINLYFGFIKNLGYSIITVVVFWMPKIILCLLLYIFIWNNQRLLLSLTLLLLFIHVISNQYKDFMSLFVYIRQRFAD
jgi:hypothetical protein